MGKLIHLLGDTGAARPGGAGRGGRGQVSFCFPPPPSPPPVTVSSLDLVRVQVVLCEICCQVNYCHRTGPDVPAEIKKCCSVGRQFGGSFFIDEETLTEVQLVFLFPQHNNTMREVQLNNETCRNGKTNLSNTPLLYDSYRNMEGDFPQLIAKYFDNR